MTITASQYLFKASAITSTTTATVGAYTVPASTRGEIVAVTVANTATTNVIAYCTVELFDGSTAYNISGTKVPIYPGGSFLAVGAQKMVLPTSGAVYVTSFSTTGITAVAQFIELT